MPRIGQKHHDLQLAQRTADLQQAEVDRLNSQLVLAVSLL